MSRRLPTFTKKMLDLQLIHLGNGRFAAASRLDHDLAAQLPVNGKVRARITQQRSSPEHRYFFAVISRAFENNRAGPSLEECPTPEHLRAWLLIKAGHCDTQTFEPRAVTAPVVRWMKSVTPMTFWSVAKDGTIIARTAKSISFSKADESVFNPIVNKIIDIIVAEVVPGTTHADWAPDKFHDDGIMATRRLSSSR